MSKKSFAALLKAIRRRLTRSPDPQDDPYARVRVPLRKGPRDRSAAVALKLPDE
jgi:hypothetical protein